jgi:hypothetical protein
VRRVLHKASVTAQKGKDESRTTVVGPSGKPATASPLE